MARKMKLDFTGVESYLRASEGVHVCKIATADEKTSSGGNEMIVVAYEVIKGDDKGARVYENYPLIDTALWKLKGLLQAIGMKADGKVQLDLDKLIGKVCQITVKHEEYEGKTRARVDSIAKYSAAVADEDTDSDEEDDVEEEEEQEEVKPKKAEKKPTPKKAPMPEPEDDALFCSKCGKHVTKQTEFSNEEVKIDGATHDERNLLSIAEKNLVP